MLEFSPIFGETDAIELTDAELEAVCGGHGGRGHGRGWGDFGAPYGGLYGYGFAPTFAPEVLLLTTVPSETTTAPSTVQPTTTAPVA
jgi:hypothetical protein